MKNSENLIANEEVIERIFKLIEKLTEQIVEIKENNNLKLSKYSSREQNDKKIPTWLKLSCD